jgi:hypothetical protein
MHRSIVPKSGRGRMFQQRSFRDAIDCEPSAWVSATAPASA